MISRERLKAGGYYFFVTYEDRDLTVPVIETLRFQNEVREEAEKGALLVFERLGNAEPQLCRLQEDLLGTVFDFEGLVSELEANREAQRAGRPYEPLPPDER